MGILTDLGEAGSTGFLVKKAISAYAARQHRESSKFTSVNQNGIYYMDVGVWAGGADGKPKTTFGVVCGRDILLCSWMNLCEKGVQVRDTYEIRFEASDDHAISVRAPLSPGSRNVLQAAKARNRGFVVQATMSLKELTDPNEPLVIIPDLHLTLYAEQRVDRFRYQGESSLTSLDAELRSLVDAAKSANARLIQVGDMYEIWESEILLRYQYLQMQSVARGLYNDYRVEIRPDFAYMLQTGKVIPRDTEIGESSYAALTQKFTQDQIDREGVPFWDTGEIAKAIRAARPHLFINGKEEIFDYRIYGNHDNFLDNPYWSKVADDAYKTDPMLGKPTVGATPAKDNLQFGPVWVEHGHKWDWHNANDAFWKEDRGFDVVVFFVSSAGSSIFGKRSGMQDTAITLSNMLPEWLDYKMRLPALRRADEIFEENPEVRLVIMGHTHSETIIEAAARVSLFEQDPGAFSYYDGRYWYLGAAEEDRRKKEADDQFERQRQKQIEHNWDKR